MKFEFLCVGFLTQTVSEIQTKLSGFKIGPWWWSGLERQSHDAVAILKVKGSKHGLPKTFFRLQKPCLESVSRYLDFYVAQPQFSVSESH